VKMGGYHHLQRTITEIVRIGLDGYGQVSMLFRVKM